MGKIDLESAYRSVEIHPNDYESTGLQWRFPGESSDTFMFDTRLPFGAKRAPWIFHRLTQAVRRMMMRRGFEATIVYLDDWLVIAPDEDSCRKAMNVLLQLLRNLGFAISYKKVVGLTKHLTFLSIDIDSVDMKLTLPDQKVSELKELLDSYQQKRHTTTKQLQTLAGKLNWGAQVIRGGRAFLRRILDAVGTLKHPKHKVKLEPGFFCDIEWWRSFLDRFHGKAITTDIIWQDVTVESDSCLAGMGVVSGHDWFFADWQAELPNLADMHINHKEAAAVVIAARQWGHQWEGKRVIFYMDNQAAIQMVNKGTTRDPIMMELLRELFWHTVQGNFIIVARYLKGQHNLLADMVSRLTRGELLLQWALLSQIHDLHGLDMFLQSLGYHMPPDSLLLLLPQVGKLGDWRRSLIAGSPTLKHKP